MYKHSSRRRQKIGRRCSNELISGSIGQYTGGTEKVEEIGKKKMDVLKAEGSAIRSIPAYVERSDFILILVPSLYHSDVKYRHVAERGDEEIGVS